MPNTPVKHGDCRRGQKRPKEYEAWNDMKKRCNNPNYSAYPKWGGRGIKICERWSLYENFLADMGRAPSLKHSIDRIDNNGNYEPGNCRWATYSEQLSNRRIGIHYKNSGSGLYGIKAVPRAGGKTKYQVRLRGVEYVGIYNTIEEAIEARDARI